MTREQVRQILSRSKWFSGLPEALAEGILAESRIRRFHSQPVYLTGDEPNGLFLLLSGMVQLVHTTGDGNVVLLGVNNPGSSFGESSMIDGDPRLSDALAIGKVELLHLGNAGFRKLTAENVEHYAAFARLLGIHHRMAMAHIVSSATLPLRTRLAQRLLLFTQLAGRSSADGAKNEFHLSQESLASHLGVSRQTLNKLLKSFEADGLIEIRYGRIVLKAPDAIAERARA